MGGRFTEYHEERIKELWNKVRHSLDWKQIEPDRLELAECLLLGVLWQDNSEDCPCSGGWPHAAHAPNCLRSIAYEYLNDAGVT